MIKKVGTPPPPVAAAIDSGFAKARPRDLNATKRRTTRSLKAVYRIIHQQQHAWKYLLRNFNVCFLFVVVSRSYGQTFSRLEEKTSPLPLKARWSFGRWVFFRTPQNFVFMTFGDRRHVVRICGPWLGGVSDLVNKIRKKNIPHLRSFNEHSLRETSFSSLFSEKLEKWMFDGWFYLLKSFLNSAFQGSSLSHKFIHMLIFSVA